MRAAVCLIFVVGCGHDPTTTTDAAGHPDGTGSGSADLSHITLAPGWNVEVFRELAPLVPYVDQQYVDGPEVSSNQIRAPFAISGAMGQALGVVSGRAIIALTATTFALHDYGQHVPNAPGLPDLISSAVWKDNSLAVSSSSANGGDGVFTVASDWTISVALINNNVRQLALDPTGGFDAIGTAGLYFGDQSGVYRLAGKVLIVPSSDASSLHVAAGSLIYVHRLSDQAADLYQVATGTHTQTLLLHAAVIEVGEGPTTSPFLAWAVLDAARLGRVDPTDPAGFGEVASTTPDYTWFGAMAPPAGHALGDATYVIESNRALGVDRVLRFTHP